MATKIFDGFDHYNTSTDLYARSGWLQWQYHNYTGGTTNPTVGFTTGRNGIGKALQIVSITSTPPNSFVVMGVFADRNQEAFLGWGTKMANPNGLWVHFWDTVAGAVQCSVHFNEINYSIQIYRGDGVNGVAGAGGGTLVATSGNNVWVNDTYQFIEFHPFIAAGTSGSLEVRVNNVPKLTASGINICPSGNLWFDAISSYFSPSNLYIGGNTIIYDDFYYNDTTSGPGLTPMNSYAGDSSVLTIVPVGNDSVQFTPFANTNWQEVSELAMDSDVSYNFSSTVGQEDRFNFQTILTALSTVYAVQVTGAYRKDDGGTRTIEQAVKSGATEVYSSGHNIPDTAFAYFTDIWVLNPATSLNWTVTDVNSIKAGYKLTA